MDQDVSNIIKGTGIALEREALTRFGAAVNDVGAATLRDIFNLPKPAVQPQYEGANGVWNSTSFAAALVKSDQIAFNPKLKFLFKVSFEFEPEVLASAASMGYDVRKIQQGISFTVTRVDRPKWDYVYEEVNMYNYRTKVLKEIKHREIGFTLYDDVGNAVLDFINLYRKLLQPIGRNQSSSGSLEPENHGMDFTPINSGAYLDTSMRGVLPGNAINVLRKMTIHQLFVERGSRMDNSADWVKAVNFEFYRPRFTSIDIDDMDHENGSNYSLVNFTVDFDTVFITEKETFKADRAPVFPIHDISSNGTGSLDPAGGERNPFLEIIANQAGRAVQTGISNIIHKNLGTTAGGQIVAGQLSGIGGTLGEAARRTLQGSTGYAIPSTPFVRDSNTPSSRSIDLSSRTDSDE